MILKKALFIDMRNDKVWIMQKDSLERFKKTWNYWLIEKWSILFNYIYKLLNYEFIISKNNITCNKIKWLKNDKILFYENQILKMINWSQFILKIIDYLKNIMNEYLLFRKNENFFIINLYEFELNNLIKHEIDYYFVI